MGVHNEQEPSFMQPWLDGLQAPEQQETELDNCLILLHPRYTDTGKRQEWECAIHAQPTIFQPDIDAKFLAFSTGILARQAHRKRLKPGDRAVLRGVVSTQELTLQNGETQCVNQIAVTSIEVISREKRVSTTVFEQKRTRWS